MGIFSNGNTAVNETDKHLGHHGAYILVKRNQNNQHKIYLYIHYIIAID